MTFTDVATVSAVMGKTFDSTTNPTDVQVSGSIIPIADSIVSADSTSGASTEELKALSTFMTAHIITVSKNVDFRSADVSISVKNQSSEWRSLYEKMRNSTSSSFFTVVNG